LLVSCLGYFKFAHTSPGPAHTKIHTKAHTQRYTRRHKDTHTKTHTQRYAHNAHFRLTHKIQTLKLMLEIWWIIKKSLYI